MEEQLFEALKKEFRRRVFDESYTRIYKCLGSLSTRQIWYKPNDSSNSVGMLVRHLCGNMRQWILTGLGGLPDSRNRNIEFETRHDFNSERLMRLMEELRMEVEELLVRLPIDDLIQKREVQVFEESGFSVFIHVIEHFSYHTGQIAYITKMLKDEQLNFYGEMNLG
jgi:uncharacterized damage-inducible protein DinB